MGVRVLPCAPSSMEQRQMANVKKGQLVRAPEWWKHLRWVKRVFWKKHREAEKRLVRRCSGETGTRRSAKPL